MASGSTPCGMAIPQSDGARPVQAPFYSNFSSGQKRSVMTACGRKNRFSVMPQFLSPSPS